MNTTIQKLIQNWPITSSGLTMMITGIVHLIFMVKSGAADETTWERGLAQILGGFGLMATGHAIATNKQDRVQSMSVLEQKVDANKMQIAQNKQQSDTAFAQRSSQTTLRGD